MSLNYKQDVLNTSTNSNIQNIKQKSFDKFKPYYQGIICNRDQRESGKKRNKWTNFIIVILILSIVLLIISITLGSNGINSWWIYLILGIIGTIGCVIGHYYNTKMYIENSKYDIDIDDITKFREIKTKIKTTIQTISQNQKEIDSLNKQINIIIGKNKAKSLASSIASSTSKGIENARQSIASSTAKGIENAKTGFSSFRNKIASSSNKVVPVNSNTEVTTPSTNATTQPPMTSAANEFYVGGDVDPSVPEDPNKQSVPVDPKLKTLEDNLVLAKNNLQSNKKLLNDQMMEYNKLKLLNDDYKKIKMANQHNKNIIYNISDLYSAKSLLDDINDINYENTGNLLSMLNDVEQNIFNEYMAIIDDIKKLKSLNNEQNDISQKIIDISKIYFNIQYLNTIKENNLNKYIDEFFNDIDETLIKKSDIDKYFTIIDKKKIINDSLVNYTSQNTIFNTKYTLIYTEIKDKYTNLAIENINNIIEKNNEYSDKKVNELIEQYNKYSNKDLGDAFKLRYAEIMEQLVIDFGKYVYNVLGYSNTLKDLLTTEDIDNKITAIQNFDIKITAIKNHKEGILKPLDSSTLHRYTTYPIISSNPNPNSRESLLKIIAEPFVNELDKAYAERTKLVKAEAEADAKKQAQSIIDKGLALFK